MRSAEGWLPALGRVLHRCSGAGERAGSQFRSARGSSKPVPATPGHFAAFSAKYRQRRGKLPLMLVAVPDNSLSPSGNGHTRAGCDVLGTVGDAAVAAAEQQVSPCSHVGRGSTAGHRNGISAPGSCSSAPSSHTGRKGRRAAHTGWMFPKLWAGQCGMAPSRNRRAAEISSKGSCVTRERLGHGGKTSEEKQEPPPQAVTAQRAGGCSGFGSSPGSSSLPQGMRNLHKPPLFCTGRWEREGCCKCCCRGRAKEQD